MRWKVTLGLAACLLAGVTGVRGQEDGGSIDTVGPDVIVGDLQDLHRWGATGSVQAYSVGTTSCNVGDTPLLWQGSTNKHPVIGQNMFRYKDGRFEQIGQSWLKWAFVSVNGSFCGACQDPGTGTLLGVNCSDPYGSTLNGSQGSLGPKSVVNPFTGAFPASHSTPGSGTIDGRLQVHNDDVNTTLNPNALYFVEGHYVTPDDATAHNLNNNASYRQIWVNASYAITFNNPIGGTSATVRTQAAIQAWKTLDPLVELITVDVPGDGRLYLGARATSLGNGNWHYEFAIHNLNSDRAIQAVSFSIPDGTTAANLGFHDVDYHSGEPYDGTDWTTTVATSNISFATGTYASNPNANALRWGTLYNFWFDSTAAPTAITQAELTLFKPGTPTSVIVPLAITPPACPGDGDCDGTIGFGDIDYFVAAIPDNQTAWAALYADRHAGQQPPCAFLNCDIDHDGHVGFSDIDSFVNLIPSACP